MSKSDLPALASILAALGIPALNEMQQSAIAANKAADNVVLLSPTGSGKTLAFLLPVLQRLHEQGGRPGALIITPSRELALQTESVFRKMGTGMKVTCCYGGHLRETEERSLTEPPPLIIGTPGRLADHIRRGNFDPAGIHTLVLDEFDKSLELGFQAEVEEIVSSLAGLQKRILTSATDSVEIPDFLGMDSAARLDFLPEEKEPDVMLAFRTVQSPGRDKLDTLVELLKNLGARATIIFCNHREAVERTSAYLKEAGILNERYHGAMEQRERESALCKFRNGSVNFLVTTDLAARGLDIPNIRYIVHYHLPDTADSYTHRNGRTARMDTSGTVITILGPDEALPDYAAADGPEEMELEAGLSLPEKPKWITLFIAAGKKDKVNKVDIVGFLGQQGDLKKEDIGLIEVKDFYAFVAIRKSKATHALHLIREQKLKGRKVKIDIAR